MLAMQKPMPETLGMQPVEFSASICELSNAGSFVRVWWRGVVRRHVAQGPAGAALEYRPKNTKSTRVGQIGQNSLLGRSKLPLAIVSQSVPAATRTKRSCSYFASRATTIWTILQKPRCARRTHPQSQHVVFVLGQRTYICWQRQKQIEASRVFKHGSKLWCPAECPKLNKRLSWCAAHCRHPPS